jgi:hypothetical protein
MNYSFSENVWTHFDRKDNYKLRKFALFKFIAAKLKRPVLNPTETDEKDSFPQVDIEGTEDD